ncbi:Endonuclease/exonuclease/phosphatase [Clohesyomyces aquaticus]|uniref:Endonuclease/exonuclease/phosphatase n=1 Tax=Clohesyomyces aquaticus TaxID=1231657 RepID=A0A1Y1Y7I7_9PLEO|nr:Endonuclease/exonuclease/phosphatase [Clohesyomyces aquaticus]
MISKSMLESLLKKQLTHMPKPQPFYTFYEDDWQCGPDPTTPSSLFSTLHLLTWNIDFMAKMPRERMASAITHLSSIVEKIPNSSRIVIFLQEMQQANDLRQLAETAWIRDRFCMTDLGFENWGARYGTVTLVDRRLNIVEVSRLKFISEYERDALFVDVEMPGGEGELLRLCNVHLDSMSGEVRPIQWKAAAQWLQKEDERVVASILAGDCNATRPRDRTEPMENGFKDAYLELGGVDGDEGGATWGFQSPSGASRGVSRLDKVVYWGDVKVTHLERIGVGVEVEDEEAKEQLGDWPFVTDHYGLMAEFEVGEWVCAESRGMW